MKQQPRSVIHFSFIAGSLVFDPRPIWAAAREAEKHGKLQPNLATHLFNELGETAIHLGTRHYIMQRATEELKNSLHDIYNLVPEPWAIPDTHGFRVVSGKDSERARDRALLAIDSFLFEFRAFLELLAQFAYRFLVQIGKRPMHSQVLRSGKAIVIAGQRNKLKPHALLLYLADMLGVSTDWYQFLNTHRNFFTHEGAPYCAIEDRMVRPPEFDLLVMKANIHDFAKADPSDYFRISECQLVIQGLRSLSVAVQNYLIKVLG